MSIDTKRLTDADEATSFEKHSFIPFMDGMQDGKLCKMTGLTLQTAILDDHEIGGDQADDITTNSAVQNITNKTLRNCDIVNDHGETIASLDDIAEDVQKNINRYNYELVKNDSPWRARDVLIALGCDLTHIIMMADLRVESCLVSVNGIDFMAIADPNLVTINATDELFDSIVFRAEVDTIYMKVSLVLTKNGEK